MANDLERFLEEGFQEGMVVKIDNISYYQLEGVSVSHVDVDATLGLTQSNRSLFGNIHLNRIKDENLRDHQKENILSLRLALEERDVQVAINCAQNYLPHKRISFYSGDVGQTNSWSIHCDIS